MTAITTDVGTMKKKGRVDVVSQLVSAAKQTGRSPVAMALDFFKLRKRRGKLRFYEYFLYELYDTERWTDAERDQFISAHVHWPVVNKCNDPHWWAVTEDKWLSSDYLHRNAIPVPRNRAVYDPGIRAYSEVPKLQSAEDLRAFFAGCESYPIFVKPIGGMWSAGAMRISGHTDTHVLVDGGEPLTYAQLAEDAFANQAYVFQDCLTPHPFFDGITDATATVRCVNILTDDGPAVPFTLLKLPLRGNTADNFWRAGNVLCHLDPATGEILGLVTTQDGRRCELEALPDTGRELIGERLPHWQDLRALNERVALLHTANRYGSTDIALTEDGPVIVEVNNGCAFELVQIGTGRGLLTDEMTRLFRSCGVEV